MISGLYQEIALLLIQAREMGIDLPVIGGNGFNSPELMKIAGEAVEGALVGSPWFADNEDSAVQDFVSEYNRLYHATPDQFAAQSYDALMMMAEAMSSEGASDNRAKFRDALAAIKNYQGVTGKFSFDDNGNPLMDAKVLELTNGTYRELK